MVTTCPPIFAVLFCFAPRDLVHYVRAWNRLTETVIQTHPWPRVTKLCPDDCFDWVIVSIPILTTTINNATFHAFKDIPKTIMHGKKYIQWMKIKKEIALL